MLHPKKICRSCGAIPKASISFICHSPNVAIVTEYLKKQQSMIYLLLHRMSTAVIDVNNLFNVSQGESLSMLESLQFHQLLAGITPFCNPK